MSRRIAQPPRPVCAHRWQPWRANWEFATCELCQAEAMWSYILGKYVRLIPESWTPQVRERRVNARQKRYARPKA